MSPDESAPPPAAARSEGQPMQLSKLMRLHGTGAGLCVALRAGPMDEPGCRRAAAAYDELLAQTTAALTTPLATELSALLRPYGTSEPVPDQMTVRLCASALTSWLGETVAQKEKVLRAHVEADPVAAMQAMRLPHAKPGTTTPAPLKVATARPVEQSQPPEPTGSAGGYL